MARSNTFQAVTTMAALDAAYDTATSPESLQCSQEPVKLYKKRLGNDYITRKLQLRLSQM